MSSDKHGCVPGYTENQGRKQVLHRFPNPIKERECFNKWVYAVGGYIIGLETERIYRYRRVCRKHFEVKYLCRSNKIANTAMPTLYMPGPLTLPNYTLSERNPMNLIQTYDDNILKPSTSTDPSVEANISHPSISTIGNVLSPCAIKKMIFRKVIKK